MKPDGIMPLFPRVVSTSFYPESFDEELKYLRSLEYSSNGDMSPLQSMDTFVLDKPPMKKIRRFIESKIKKHVMKIFESKQDLKITQSWVNKLTTNRFHSGHIHPNSYLSGVWYPVIDPSHPPIQFIDHSNFQMQLSGETSTELNSMVMSLTLEPGQLIVFPSNMFHRVLPNGTNSERISLSFNTWASGPLGEIENLTYAS